MKLSIQIYIRRPQDDMNSDIHDWLCIHDTRRADNTLISPKCTLEKGKISTLTFKAHQNNPAFTLLRPENTAKCEVWVCERVLSATIPEGYNSQIYPCHRWYQENREDDKYWWRYDLFVGHGVGYTPYFNSNGMIEVDITCADHADYMNDFIVPREEYNLSTNGAGDKFTGFIQDSYDELGGTTITFGRDSLHGDADVSFSSITPDYQYIVDFETLYEVLTDRFVNRFGGLMVTDYSAYVIVGQIPAGETEKEPDKYDDGVEIRWILENQYGRHRDLTISKGVNLKELRLETDDTGFCTRLYPVGALKEDGSRVSLLQYQGHGHDPNTTYIDISNATYIADHGVKSLVQEWQDITTKSALYTAAVDWLTNQNKIKKCYTVSALDLSVINNPANRFRVGDWHYIIHQDMGINVELQIVKIEYDLSQPQNVTLTMGDKLLNASEQRVAEAFESKGTIDAMKRYLGGA